MLLSIIVPILNVERITDTKTLALNSVFAAIESTVKCDYEIIVIINGNYNETVVNLKDYGFKYIEIKINCNVGVSRAWNIGANASRGKFLCFMNDDVVLGDNCVTLMIDYLKSHENVGMVGPLGAKYSFDNNVIKHIDFVHKTIPMECDALSGFLFIVQEDVFRKVGGADIRFTPASCEEIDLSFQIKKYGFKLIVFPGLKYYHKWGISSKPRHYPIKYFDEEDEVGLISDRNKIMLNDKWLTGCNSIDNKHGCFYDNNYFCTNDYIKTMLEERIINGKKESPLVKTMCNMIETTGLIKKGDRILDVGCAYGYVVEELVKRGYDAYGIDLSSDCIDNSPVKERLKVGNAIKDELNGKYKLIILTNLFEHLSTPESLLLISKLYQSSSNIFTIINKSTHDSLHINLRTNYLWINNFESIGYHFNRMITKRVRAYYKTNTSGLEKWHNDTLIFSSDIKQEKNMFLRLEEDMLSPRSLLLTQYLKRMLPNSIKAYWSRIPL